MKPLAVLSLLLVCFVPTKLAFAVVGVSVDSMCYVLAQSASGKPSFFRLQTYQDDNLQRMVGGIVVYNNGRTPIPIVEVDEQQVDTPDIAQTDYRRFWLEIVDRKITGQYVEYGSLTGNPGGRYVRYTSFKTNRVTLFRAATLSSPCEERAR